MTANDKIIPALSFSTARTGVSAKADKLSMLAIICTLCIAAKLYNLCRKLVGYLIEGVSLGLLRLHDAFPLSEIAGPSSIAVSGIDFSYFHY